MEIALWITVVLLLLLSAFFSAAETAYTSARKAKISVEANKGSSIAKLIKKQRAQFGWTLSTILVLNNLVNIAMSTFTAYLIARAIGGGITATIISTAVITPVIVIFGEIIPKLLATKFPYTYLKLVARIFWFLNILLSPITYPLSKLKYSSNITNTEKDLQSFLDVARQEGVLEKQEASLAKNALRLDSIIVEDIYVEIENVTILNINDKPKDILKVFASSGHSRLPVKQGNKFIGVILLKDFIYNSNAKLEELVIQVPYVSKYKLANLTLEKMRSHKSHIAFVTNTEKDKKVIGIVTIEDIIEELIGEVYDEHDTTKKIREIGLYKYRAVGSASMKLLSQLTKTDYESNGEETLKHWISSRITRTIKTGLKYTYKDKVQFTIVSNKKNQETIIDIKIK